MLVFKKDGAVKLISAENKDFIDLVKKLGWVEEVEKETKNGKSSKSSGKPSLSDSAE